MRKNQGAEERVIRKEVEGRKGESVVSNSASGQTSTGA